jgi:hypothetical protein
VRDFPSLRCPLRHYFSALLPHALHCLQHPCPTYCSFCSDSCRWQVHLSAGHSPAGRNPSRAAPGTRHAGRTRPRGPESLYTVRRDLDGHGGPDVMGARDLDGHVGLGVLGDAKLPCQWPSCGRAGDVPPGPVTRRGRDGVCFAPAPTARVGTYGGCATWSAAREGRDRPDGA